MSVTGYRVWHIGSADYRVKRSSVLDHRPDLLLRALHDSYHWPPGRLMRALPCRACHGKAWSLDDHGVWRDVSPLFGKTPGCHCGLHAVIHPMDLRGHIGGVRFGSTVLGKVEIGGRVMAHARGYRAELGKVTALYFIRALLFEFAEAKLRAEGVSDEIIEYRRQYYERGPVTQLEKVAALYGVPLLAIEDEEWGEAWLEPIKSML